MPCGRIDQQALQRCDIAAERLVEPHHQIDALRFVDRLRDDASVQRGLQQLVGGRDLQAVAGGRRTIDADLDLRDERLLLDRDVDDPGDLPDRVFDHFCGRAQALEVGAEQLDRDLRLDAGQDVVEAMRDRLTDVEGDALKRREARSHGLQNLLAAALRGPEHDVDLGVVHPLRMVVELRASRCAGRSTRRPGARAVIALPPGRWHSMRRARYPAAR